MFMKLSISAMAIAAVLTLTQSANASAEAYKTNEGQVIVTGLPPTQRYQIRVLTADNKSTSRQDKAANNCGEVVIDAAANYKILVVGTETFEPATLPIKSYVRCPPKPRTGSTMTPSGVVRATPPVAK